MVVQGRPWSNWWSPGPTWQRSVAPDVDILVHPGLITLEEARLAKENGVYLEVSLRKGHSFSNGHVVNMARKAGAKLLINSDAHTPTTSSRRNWR